MRGQSRKFTYRITALTAVLVCFVVCCWGGAALSMKNADEVLQLMAGTSQVYSVPFKVEKIATGDAKIFGVAQTGESEMVINAVSEGTSNLILFGANKQKKELLISVLSPDLVLRADELRKVLRDIDGVEVKIVGKQIVIDGQIVKTKDLIRINQLLASMRDVVNIVQMSEVMKRIVAEQMQSAINRPNIHVSVAKSTFLIEGVVPNEEEAQRAEKIAQAYNPNVINALVSAKSQERPKPYEKPDILEINLTIMEVQKDALKRFGIYWNPDITTQANPSMSHTSNQKWYPYSASVTTDLAYTMAGVISNFFPKMRRIHDEGFGRTLMQQTLVTKNGAKAKFFAGSEQPIPVSQSLGNVTIEYKKVGMTLDVTPSIDPLDNIDTILQMESSTVTGTSAQGAPIVRTNNMNTAVNVKRGVTIVLGGLAGERELRSLQNHNPDNTPTMFQANYDKSRTKEQTEVVVFITPRVVEDVKMAGRDVQLGAKEEFKRVELDNLRKVFDDKFK